MSVDQNVSKLGIASVTLRASQFPLSLFRVFGAGADIHFSSVRCGHPALDLTLQGSEGRPELLQRCHVRHDQDPTGEPYPRPRSIPEPFDYASVSAIRERQWLCPGEHIVG